jgi:Uncharacterised protein family UPF0547
MNRPGNPLGLGLVIVGAFAMALSAFLPLDEPTGVFRVVEDNTLIQHGGWALIALAVGIAATGFRVNQRNGNGWPLPVVLCVLAAFRIVLWAVDKGTRTLYPVGANGTPDASQPGVVVPLGIAIYVAGAGVAVAITGALMLRQVAKSLAPEAVEGPVSVQANTRKCPDCAETILVDAKVCKHCGYRFGSREPDVPQNHAPGKTSKVKCHHCQHVQAVPLNQSTFQCEQCDTKLRRRTTPTKSG